MSKHENQQLKKLGFWRQLPLNVIMLGLVSFFTDASSEMIYPLIPLFLVKTLGATPAILGVVEGIAEAAASFLKALSGYVSDRYNRRKPLIAAGYGISSFIRPLMGFATSWPFVLFVRFSDRLGKGIRTSPRDALIADSTPSHRFGTAYSVQRAMDHAGAVAGPFMAFFLLKTMGLSIRTIFFLALIPGTLAVATIIVGVRDIIPPSGNVRVKQKISVKGFHRPFYTYLVILFLFTLGNASDAFILLKAGEVAGNIASIPLLWALFHLAKSLVSLPAGYASDRLGRKEVIIAGWIIYAAAYAGFARASSNLAIVATFLLYALYYGFTEGVEKALVAELVPETMRGSAFGLFNFTIGVASLPASLIFGYVWTRYGGPVAFYLSAAIAALASLLMALLVSGTQKHTA